MREDKQLLIITHLSQLVTLSLAFGSLLIPLVIWITQKDKVIGMDEEGKKILNFQISLAIYWVVCVPLILFFGLGLLGFLILGIVSIIFPIINAIKVSNDQPSRYPLSFNFIN